MDELDFKRHLRDLAHGHHHPEKHDWGPGDKGRSATSVAQPTAKTQRTSKRRKAVKKRR
jgi:hypothetical protein